MQNIQCIIFDCDGTLVDSEFLCNLGLSLKLKELGIERNAEDIMNHYRGVELKKIVESLGQEHGFVVNDDFIPTYREIVKTLFDRHLKTISGVESCLEQIEMPMCVASNGPQQKTRYSLKVTGLAK